MCDYIKRMSTQNTPTDNIRLWSGQTHSVVEYTGPKPFGMDGSVRLWLHERSATQLLDMCDELDAKFSDLKTENEKLRRLVRALSSSLSCEHGWCSGKCEEILGCTDLNYCVADRIMAECMMEVG